VKQARITAKSRIEIVDVPEPTPGADEIKIQVCCCGICGSDVLEYLYPVGFSQCLGHEFTGVVTQAGVNVQNVRVGDRVAAYAYDAGGFGEYAVITAEYAVVLPEKISTEVGCLLEPVTVVLSGLRQCGFRIGDTCFVSGCGSIGLIGIELVRAFGARKIIASEPNPHRRGKAEQFGADVVVDPTCQFVEDAVLGSAADKVDFSLECAGTGDSLLACMRVTRVGHTVCALGLTPQRLDVSTYDLFLSNVKFQGATPYNFKLFESSVRLIADDRINPDRLITHRYGLEDIAEAFDLAAAPNTDALKILIACATI